MVNKKDFWIGLGSRIFFESFFWKMKFENMWVEVNYNNYVYFRIGGSEL